MSLPDDLISYPCEFPIKIMGPNHPDFVTTITAIVKQHAPSFHADEKTLQIRPSREGRYTAMTVTILATSRSQLDQLYRALSSHSMVKFVL